MTSSNDKRTGGSSPVAPTNVNQYSNNGSHGSSGRACDQNALEAAILLYQKERSRDPVNQRALEEAYTAVSDLYPPLAFVRVWFKKYRYLFDTREDFINDYLFLFCEALAEWKPRGQRGASRFGGSGEFKNYFWSVLQNNYINMVKAEAAAKRNMAVACPICEKWVNTLSTHLKEDHQHILWEHLVTLGFDPDNLIDCPLCTSHRVRKHLTACAHSEKKGCPDCLQAIQTAGVKQHMVSMHLSLLFERFRELYPQYVTLTPRPMSVNYDRDGECEDIYDRIADRNRVELLLSSQLTPLQREIVERVLVGGAVNIAYDAVLYKCSPTEFERSITDLRDKMTLFGLEG